MTTVEQIQTFKYKLEHMLEEVNLMEETLIAERRNVRLSAPDANRVLGYKKESYVWEIGVPFDQNKSIWSQDLKAWVATHKPNRLKYFNKNIEDFL